MERIANKYIEKMLFILPLLLLAQISMHADNKGIFQPSTMIGGTLGLITGCHSVGAAGLGLGLLSYWSGDNNLNYYCTEELTRVVRECIVVALTAYAIKKGIEYSPIKKETKDSIHQGYKIGLYFTIPISFFLLPLSMVWGMIAYMY